MAIGSGIPTPGEESDISSYLASLTPTEKNDLQEKFTSLERPTRDRLANLSKDDLALCSPRSQVLAKLVKGDLRVGKAFQSINFVTEPIAPKIAKPVSSTALSGEASTVAKTAQRSSPLRAGPIASAATKPASSATPDLQAMVVQGAVAEARQQVGKKFLDDTFWKSMERFELTSDQKAMGQEPYNITQKHAGFSMVESLIEKYDTAYKNWMDLPTEGNRQAVLKAGKAVDGAFSEGIGLPRMKRKGEARTEGLGLLGAVTEDMEKMGLIGVDDVGKLRATIEHMQDRVDEILKIMEAAQSPSSARLISRSEKLVKTIKDFRPIVSNPQANARNQSRIESEKSKLKIIQQELDVRSKELQSKSSRTNQEQSELENIQFELQEIASVIPQQTAVSAATTKPVAATAKPLSEKASKLLESVVTNKNLYIGYGGNIEQDTVRSMKSPEIENVYQKKLKNRIGNYIVAYKEWTAGPTEENLQKVITAGKGVRDCPWVSARTYPEIVLGVNKTRKVGGFDEYVADEDGDKKAINRDAIAIVNQLVRFEALAGSLDEKMTLLSEISNSTVDKNKKAVAEAEITRLQDSRLQNMLPTPLPKVGFDDEEEDIPPPPPPEESAAAGAVQSQVQPAQAAVVARPAAQVIAPVVATLTPAPISLSKSNEELELEELIEKSRTLWTEMSTPGKATAAMQEEFTGLQEAIAAKRNEIMAPLREKREKSLKEIEKILEGSQTFDSEIVALESAGKKATKDTEFASAVAVEMQMRRTARLALLQTKLDDYQTAFNKYNSKAQEHGQELEEKAIFDNTAEAAKAKIKAIEAALPKPAVSGDSLIQLREKRLKQVGISPRETNAKIKEQLALKLVEVEGQLDAVVSQQIIYKTGRDYARLDRESVILHQKKKALEACSSFMNAVETLLPEVPTSTAAKMGEALEEGLEMIERATASPSPSLKAPTTAAASQSSPTQVGGAAQVVQKPSTQREAPGVRTVKQPVEEAAQPTRDTLDEQMESRPLPRPPLTPEAQELEDRRAIISVQLSQDMAKLIVKGGKVTPVTENWMRFVNTKLFPYIQSGNSDQLTLLERFDITSIQNDEERDGLLKGLLNAFTNLEKTHEADITTRLKEKYPKKWYESHSKLERESAQKDVDSRNIGLFLHTMESQFEQATEAVSKEVVALWNKHPELGATMRKVSVKSLHGSRMRFDANPISVEFAKQQWKLSDWVSLRESLKAKSEEKLQKIIETAAAATAAAVESVQVVRDATMTDEDFENIPPPSSGAVSPS